MFHGGWGVLGVVVLYLLVVWGCFFINIVWWGIYWFCFGVVMRFILDRLDDAFVREGMLPGVGGLISWICPRCRAKNGGKRRRCQRCRARRPRDI